MLQGRPGKKFVTKHAAANKRKYSANFGSSAAHAKFAPRWLPLSRTITLTRLTDSTDSSRQMPVSAPVLVPLQCHRRCADSAVSTAVCHGRCNSMQAAGQGRRCAGQPGADRQGARLLQVWRAWPLRQGVPGRAVRHRCCSSCCCSGEPVLGLASTTCHQPRCLKQPAVLLQAVTLVGLKSSGQQHSSLSAQPDNRLYGAAGRTL